MIIYSALKRASNSCQNLKRIGGKSEGECRIWKQIDYPRRIAQRIGKKEAGCHGKRMKCDRAFFHFPRNWTFLRHRNEFCESWEEVCTPGLIPHWGKYVNHAAWQLLQQQQHCHCRHLWQNFSCFSSFARSIAEETCEFLCEKPCKKTFFFIRLVWIFRARQIVRDHAIKVHQRKKNQGCHDSLKKAQGCQTNC